MARLLAAALLLLAAGTAQAQEGDDPIDVDFGSSRIGGPGATARERAAVRALEEEEEYLTEETLPPVGHKKRLPGLHVLAKRSASGKDWEAACMKYDQIQEEGGEEAMDLHPEAKRYAWRAYLACAERQVVQESFEKAERLLKKSEKFGPADHRHAGLRRKMMQAEYKKAVLAGDMAKAVELFDRYQGVQEDEDERIWMGAEIARRAKEAHEAGDKAARDQLMRYGERIAPMNTDLRALKDSIEFQANVGKNLGLLAGAALLLVFGFAQFSRWRGRRRVEAAAGGKLGKKNKFIDDD